MEEKITDEDMAENLKNYWAEIWHDVFLAFILTVLLLLSVLVLIAYMENSPRFALIVLFGDFVILAALSLCFLIASIRDKRPSEHIYIFLFLFFITFEFCRAFYIGYGQLE